MFNKVLNILKNPVTTIAQKAETADIKKNVIKSVILSIVIAVTNLISTIVSIIFKFTKNDFWYKNYSSSQLWEKRFEAMGKAQLFDTFFKDFIIALLVTFILAGILFLITKIAKGKKSYASILSMINSIIIISIIGIILKLILSFVYEPLALLVMFVVCVYAFFSLIFAFRDSLEIENANTLVLAIVGVLTIATIILVVIFCMMQGVPISDIGGFLNLLG